MGLLQARRGSGAGESQSPKTKPAEKAIKRIKAMTAFTALTSKHTSLILTEAGCSCRFPVIAYEEYK